MPQYRLSVRPPFPDRPVPADRADIDGAFLYIDLDDAGCLPVTRPVAGPASRVVMMVEVSPAIVLRPERFTAAVEGADVVVLTAPDGMATDGAEVLFEVARRLLGERLHSVIPIRDHALREVGEIRRPTDRVVVARSSSSSPLIRS